MRLSRGSADTRISGRQGAHVSRTKTGTQDHESRAPHGRGELRRSPSMLQLPPRRAAQAAHIGDVTGLASRRRPRPHPQIYPNLPKSVRGTSWPTRGAPTPPVPLRRSLRTPRTRRLPAEPPAGRSAPDKTPNRVPLRVVRPPRTVHILLRTRR